MPKTVLIRDIDDDVYARLARRADEAGVSVPELLRTEAARLAARPTVDYGRSARYAEEMVARLARATTLKLVPDNRG